MSHHSVRWKLYQAELIHARAMRDAEPERIDYWTGYERGLQRAHYGERFGTDEEHRTWLDMVGAEAADRRARGLGYMDGLAVLASGVKLHGLRNRSSNDTASPQRTSLRPATRVLARP